ncbi:hypothetical protein [Occallatibacter riparius]|uniref:Uncharacterized protein n=1 Tax=Occallatibacter riparius TaxID=1002689 RepID=A0A9J7BQ95_9BACT|nr:hypothetical protein [Occallatibacter riparius]UWZ84963.1 hypothetical protein MOP44_03245 [Occallatibacter riparius]
MAVHFKSVSAVNLSPDNTRAGWDVFFERADTPPPTDPKVESLRGQYEETVFVLQSMDLHDEDFQNLFNALIVGAQVGLQGEISGSNLDAGANQLDQVRRKMVSLASKDRDRYLLQLVGVGVVVSLGALLLAGLVVALPHIKGLAVLGEARFQSVRAWLLPGCLLHPGLCLGVVFAAFVANRSFTFELIRKMDPYAFTPLMRILFISLVSYVLLAVLWFNIIQLGAGGYLLNSVQTNPQAGFLIGLVCGVSEPVVVQILLSRLKPEERSKKP